MTAGSELDQSPERKLWLHDDRPTAVQTSDADGIVSIQLEHGWRVAVLVDAVTRRSPLMSAGIDLFRVHALHSLSVTHENAEWPSTGQVVIDQLNRIRQNSLLSIKQHHRPTYI